MTHTVLVTDHAWPDCSIERDILARIGAELIEAPDGDEATLLTLAPVADAIATCWAPVGERVVRAAEKCCHIARLGIGLDNIAVDVATELRIPVTNIPDYCIEEVADHALALLLACARNVAFYHHRTKHGEYSLRSGPRMRRLRGKIAGLIGLGHTGQAMVPRLRALGLDVWAHTRSGNDYNTGCRMAGLNELLEHADFISLHCPLTDESRGLLGADEFSRMKSTAVLVNTSRGALLDRAALAAALTADQLGGAGLDVFDPEPPDLAEPLYRHERVIVTPHAAFLSEESLLELRRRTAEQIADVLVGNEPEHVVNPQIWNDRRQPT